MATFHEKMFPAYYSGDRGHPDACQFDANKHLTFKQHLLSQSLVMVTSDCWEEWRNLILLETVFTVRRLAKHGICRRRVSVCLSVRVCVSVTLRYCIKMAKHKITQTTPHDSPMILVF